MTGMPYLTLNPLDGLLGNQLNGLANAFDNCQSQMNAYQQMPMLNSLFAAQLAGAPTRTGIWERARARSYAEQAERIIEKIAFWRTIEQTPFIGIVARPRLSSLADRLEIAVSEAERFLEMAKSMEPTERHDNIRNGGTGGNAQALNAKPSVFRILGLGS